MLPVCFFRDYLRENIIIFFLLTFMRDGQRSVDVPDPSDEFLFIDGLALKEVACRSVSVTFDG